jgi:hypothetical protein
MRHLIVLLPFAFACGSREDFSKVFTVEKETEVRIDKVEEHGEAMTLDEPEDKPSVTDAAGRAYLAKIAATADTACKCKTEECGRSVVQSWQLALFAPSWSDYSLSPADKDVEEKHIERMITCAMFAGPDARDNVAKAKAEAKSSRAKLLASLDDPYEGESDATRTAVRALKKDLRALCACTTMECIEKLQPRFAQPPIVTTDRETELVGQLVTGVMTCTASVVVGESLAVVE